MRIAICDDDTIFNNELKQNLYDYSNKHNIESVIDTFETGNELIASETKYDLIIMDYQMQGLNGLQTVAELRKGINIFSCIIFLTSYPEIAISAYEVDTYRFVVKNTLYDGLFRALDDYRKITKTDCNIRIKSDGEFITVSTEDILYFESHDKLLLIYCLNGTQITTRCKLSEFLSKVPSTHFCQTHKSYAVNLKYISQYTGNNLKLREYAVPISRNYQKAFKDKYTIFLRDNR